MEERVLIVTGDTGEKIFIDKTFVDEYIGSEYTNKLVGALPVMNDKDEIIEYNVFRAVIIVRYSADNKMYLYDVQNIKKETRYPPWTIMSDDQKPISSFVII